MSEHVKIDYMAASGEGVAKTSSGLSYIAFTLPQERVSITPTDDGYKLEEVLESSDDRVSAVCKHFGQCGGCLLQHWKTEDYQQWKRSVVQDALKARDITIDIEPLVPAAAYQRRRATFTARVTPQGQQVGFNAFRSHDVVEIEQCPVLVPEIEKALDDIRAISAHLANNAKTFHITVTETESGLDIALTGVKVYDAKQRQGLIQQVLNRDILRLTIEDEIIIEKVKPEVHFGNALVQIPSGGFLQATKAAEDTLASLIGEGLKKVKNVADLFCGSGSFSFPLAEKMNVHGVEFNQPALKAFDLALRNAQGLKKVTYERRDLFLRPLSTKELQAFDGVVFDPPRAGAEEQAKEIAKSNVSRIVAVSCNPVTLARDIQILQAGGYTLERVIPVDQFLWSPHVEVVAYLHKRKPKPGWKL